MKIESYLAQAQQMNLTRGILLYESATQTLATIHEVMHKENESPILLPGKCLTVELIDELLKTLSNAPVARHVLPPEVLCASGSLLCWWKAASRLPIFFNTKEKKFNQGMSGKEVLHPPLVFLAKPGRLQIFALERNERPKAETILCRAPYYNLYAGLGSFEEGAMCRGNVRLPEVTIPRDILIWEKAFFDTNFTHSNLGGQKLTKHKGGHDGLWREMVECDYYSADSPQTAHTPYLVTLKQTLEETVNK